MITRLRAWVYIRESKEELLRGYSPDEMVSQCREKAEKLGADVERVIVEAGKRDEFDCPGLLEAITAAKAGEYDLLISYDMYRLSGELGKHIWVKEQIGATAVTIHYVVGEYAPGPEGELLETVQAAVGRYERMKTRARTQNGITGKLKREQPIGNGPTPYGLEKVYDETTKRPIGYRPTKQLDVVKRIIRDLQEPDGTLVKVCRQLSAEGIPTPGGGQRWRPGTITSLLGNAIYTGTYEWGKVKQTATRRADGRRLYKNTPRPADEIITFSVPAVLSMDEVERAKAAMTRRKRDRRPRRPADSDPFILRGLLRCGYCQGALSCSVNGGYRRYTCLRAYGHGVNPDERCRLPQIMADGLELDAWDQLIAAFREDRVLDEIAKAMDGGEATARHRSQIESVRAQIVRQDRRIENANDALLDAEPGSYPQADLKVKRGEAERTKKDLQTTLATLEQAAPPVLTATDAASLRAFHAELVAGIVRAGVEPAARRLRLRQCRAEATVRLAEPVRPG